MGDNDPRLDAIIERRLPYTLIDHAPDSAALTVNIDDRGAARATAEHLIALDHRRFGIVRGWENPHEDPAALHYHVDRERLLGWREGLEAAGVAWDDVAFASAPDFDFETGRSPAATCSTARTDRPRSSAPRMSWRSVCCRPPPSAGCRSPERCP